MQMRDKNYIKLDNKAMVLFNGLFINYYLLMVFSLFNARLPCFMTFLKKNQTWYWCLALFSLLLVTTVCLWMLAQSFWLKSKLLASSDRALMMMIMMLSLDLSPSTCWDYFYCNHSNIMCPYELHLFYCFLLISHQLASTCHVGEALHSQWEQRKHKLTWP